MSRKPLLRPKARPGRAPRTAARREAIPFLVGPDRWGTYHWAPSQRFRPQFGKVSLGKDRAEAETQALRLNRQAQAWAADPARRAERPQPAEREAASVGEMLARYRASGMGHMRASTKAEALSLLKRIERAWAHEQPIALTRRRVRDWLDEIGREAPQSRRQLGMRFRAVWNWALSEEVTRAPSPFGGKEEGRIRIGSGNRRKVRMSWEDARALIRAADQLGHEAVGDIIVAAFACVMRLTDAVALEASALRRAPIRPDSETLQWRLIYTQAKLQRPGKGGRLEGGVRISMALPDVVAMRLGARLDEIEAGRLAGPLFPNPRTGRPWSETELARVFRLIKAKARSARPGIDPDLHLRDCRRSGFVQYVLDKATVEWVASISGHTVEEGYAIVEHYLPKTAEQADSAVRRLSIRL